jgi:hypothetical protein
MKAAQKTNTEDFMNLPRSLATLAVTLLLQSAVLYAAQTASCTFDTFTAPSGYTLGQVQGIADDGTVVGQLVDNKTQDSVAFTRAPNGVITEYAAPKSASTWMYGRNSGGENAGFYQDSTYPGHVHGFLLQGSQLNVVNYPKAANTWVYGVNKVGTAVGSYSANASVVKGFTLASSGKYTSITYPSASVTYVMAINDNGESVGASTSGWVDNGFVWQNGKFTDVNYPKAKYGTILTGVNNSGVIVGNHLSADKSFGFFYQNAVFKNIVYSGGIYTMAGGINNNGVISGQIYTSATNSIGYTAVCK